ncbi:alpha/beta hydrolase [Planococcus antarcticus DSM 14505]|uniref:Alpha/beta hydrolase n=1 Tax=Planococcus antarcticus DSM 14505 TaxID=1185653 RepID=A0AA87ILQ9_9BACL|nr:alpha/beta fold hydrolase [Planococcus antarcticus]EIM07030.1 alpha/beta hydrolase [Planococcus antarcticus DSM 14505]
MRHIVDVNNKRMEVFLRGERGIPILILSGMGCSFEEWFEVTEALSQTNRVFMLHRPGLGESELGEEVRTSSQVVDEINQLLCVLGVDELIVLIGHSYGGLCAQHFTKLYPDKVSALLLVDSTSVDVERLDMLDLPVLNQNSSDEEWMEECKSYSFLLEKELKQIIKPVLSENQKKTAFINTKEVD